jgi:glycosyltransferase involved in cell wall biosynthesis
MANKPWMQLLAIPYIISGFIKCLQLCRQEKFDLLHVHWPFPHGLIALGASKLFKIPMLLNFHGAELLLIRKHAWVAPVLRFILSQSQAVFANSHFTAQKINALRKTEVYCSPYGTTLSSQVSTELHPVKNKFRILFVGRHIERKGLIYLIEAASKLDPSRFEVRIAGAGDLTSSLMEKAKEIAPETVVFTGKLSSKELQEEYQKANVFVLPAIVDQKGDTEGLGVVLIEAIEYALPVVASNVGGIPDVIIDHETGLLVEAKNSDALTDAFLKLESDEALSQKLVTGARAHIRKYFSWEPIIKNQIEVYESILR